MPVETGAFFFLSRRRHVARLFSLPIFQHGTFLLCSLVVMEEVGGGLWPREDKALGVHHVGSGAGRKPPLMRMIWAGVG